MARRRSRVSRGSRVSRKRSTRGRKTMKRSKVSRKRSRVSRKRSKVSRKGSTKMRGGSQLQNYTAGFDGFKFKSQRQKCEEGEKPKIDADPYYKTEDERNLALYRRCYKK